MPASAEACRRVGGLLSERSGLGWCLGLTTLGVDLHVLVEHTGLAVNSTEPSARCGRNSEAGPP